MSLQPYVFFEGVGKSPSGLTQIWNVWNKDRSAFLGRVKWWGAFRKYVFFPEAGTLYDCVCLRDIAQFLVTKTEDHKKVEL